MPTWTPLEQAQNKEHEKTRVGTSVFSTFKGHSDWLGQISCVTQRRLVNRFVGALIILLLLNGIAWPSHPDKSKRLVLPSFSRVLSDMGSNPYHVVAIRYKWFGDCFSNSSLHKATRTKRRHRKACCCVLNFNTELYMDVVGRKEVVGVGKTLM